MHTLAKSAAVLLALSMSTAVVCAERSRDVIVYSYVTEAGKKMTPPTPDHPAACLLVAGGYREEGQTVAGEKPPPPEKVDQLVRKALAADNYEGLTRDSKQIDYIIVYHWGYMNPEIEDFGGGEKIIFNQAQMLALVAGASFDRMNPGFSDYNDTIQALEENRYFLVISAYSPAAYFKHNRQKKLLWRAQMSLDSIGTDQTESLPALVSASVPYLGRTTDLPQQVNESLERPSQVILGAPEVKEYLPAIRVQDLPNAVQKN
ncbi:MAG TPA: hypothetical protein VMI53_10000 [Opitutaceae bacterium]|nr:hypothetical protein [Opitutaceae bacterium]